MTRGRLARPALAVLGIIWLCFALAILVSQLLIPPRIVLEWQTELEFETAGFNVYRAEATDGPFARVNDALIPATNQAAEGASYRFEDLDVQSGRRYFYEIEDVSMDNSSVRQQAIAAHASSLGWWGTPALAASAGIGLVLLALAFIGPKGEMA
jgi:hypothetical protein